MTGGDRGVEHDDEGPALVRPYALVQGRTRTADAEPLPVETVVVTLAGAGPEPSLESGAIVRLCTTPRSLVEVSLLLRIPVGVVRVLVADLAVADMVQVNLPVERRADGTVDRALLERVLDGLESL